jgi:hypothetical protein
MDFLAAVAVAVVLEDSREQGPLVKATLADMEPAEAAAAAARGVLELHRPQASMAMAMPTA